MSLDSLITSESKGPINLDKVIVISQPWGGLGDNLQFSTLPKLYTELGYDVYISSSNAYRNQEIFDIVWKNNPYIKGITNIPANAGACKGLRYYTDEPFKNMELSHGLTQGTDKYPQIYHKPNIISDLKDTIIIDLTSISSTYSDKFIEEVVNIINTKFPNMRKKQIRFKNIHNSKHTILNWEFIDIESIYHYTDTIVSCNTFVCLHSGSTVLASALKQEQSSPQIICFHHTPPSRKGFMFYFDNVSYMYLTGL